MPPNPRYLFILAIAIATISIQTGCQKPPRILPALKKAVPISHTGYLHSPLIPVNGSYPS